MYTNEPIVIDRRFSRVKNGSVGLKNLKKSHNFKHRFLLLLFLSCIHDSICMVPQSSSKCILTYLL